MLILTNNFLKAMLLGPAHPPAPSPYLIDTIFPGANSATLQGVFPEVNQGHAWHIALFSGSVWETTGSNLAMKNASSGVDDFLFVDAGHSDASYSCTVTFSNTADSFPGIVFNAQGGTDNYWVFVGDSAFAPTGLWQLYDWVTDPVTPVMTVTGGTASFPLCVPGGTYALKVHANGDTITFSVDGAPLQTFVQTNRHNKGSNSSGIYSYGPSDDSFHAFRAQL
jgi:hypothetical protein